MSSSILSTQSTGTPTQRVPAWKRLGLKLKAASENEASTPASHTNSAAAPASHHPSLPNGHGSSPSTHPQSSKRKPSAVPALDHSAKRPRRDVSDSFGSGSRTKTPSKQPKSVSFTAQAGEPADGANSSNKQNLPRSPKSAKPLAKKKQSNVTLGPSLDYLRKWHSARDEWKFNKNHQTRLLESAFGDGTTIPSVDINIFYEYIKPLKGYVRSRLRESAVELQKMDTKQGVEGFLSAARDSKEAKEAAAKRQLEYEEIIVGFLKEKRTPEKRRFDEVDYVLRTADMEMQRRVVKRMRAETILEELSESEESTTTTTTTTTEDTEAGKESSEGAAVGADGDKRVKLNDGSQQRVKRRRKVRTTEVEDDSSSSESDDAPDSDTSSSESSSDDSDDDDDEMQGAPLVPANENDTSSSSSSSSSEDSESEEDQDHPAKADDDDEEDDD